MAEAEDKTSDSKPVLNPPVDFEDGLTPVDVWQSLHASERNWMARAAGEPRFAFAENANASDLLLLQRLGTFPVARWGHLCDGAGWTPLGIAAASWCQGARIDQVVELYRRLERIPAPGDDLERAAAFINPALLPENRFSAIFETGKDVIGVGILIAARKEPPQIDIAPEKYATLNMQLKALIDGR